METKTKNQEWVNVTSLPYHTRKAVILGNVTDFANGRIEGFTIGHNLLKPTEGYLVGSKWAEIEPRNLSRFDLECYVGHFIDLCEKGVNIWLGGYNMPDGEKVVEYIQQINELSQAIEKGRQFDQHSIWDVVGGHEIEI
jgi:hypothetical protein